MVSRKTAYAVSVALLLQSNALAGVSLEEAALDPSAPRMAADYRDYGGAGYTSEGRLVLEPRTGGWWSTSPGASGARLWSQTKLLGAAGLATVGVLYALPESVTNWDRDDNLGELPDKWWKNVSRRPVWDRDNWFINYVGHPYCGGVYYQMARKSGYNQRDALLYTTFMSTFFWEYGIEAFAERPSIQDLIVTPLGGWLYGEWAYHCEQRIEDNDKRFLGSRIIGHTALFLLDPIDHLGRGVNWLLGDEWFLTGRMAGSASPLHDNTYAAHGRRAASGFQIALEHRF